MKVRCSACLLYCVDHSLQRGPRESPPLYAQKTKNGKKNEMRKKVREKRVGVKNVLAFKIAVKIKKEVNRSQESVVSVEVV